MEFTIREIKKFVAPDGFEFDTFKEAKDHAKCTHATGEIYKVLKDGDSDATLGDLLNIAKYIVDNRSVFIGILNEIEDSRFNK